MKGVIMKKINIMTYNIQHGINHLVRLNEKKTIIELEKVAEIIKKHDIDIVGLNEVYDAPEENLQKQAAIIAKKLGYNYYYFGKAINIKDGEYGNALISKYPIIDAKTIMIPDPIIKDEKAFYETRNLLKCLIKIDNEEYNVIVSHFGLANSEKVSAVKTLVEELENNKLKNVIFMGDLNMEYDNKNYQELENHLLNIVSDKSFTYPSHCPEIRIDHIFVSEDFTKNNEIIDSLVLDEIFSDHLPIKISFIKK